MYKVGFVGLGKLGLPVAVAMAARGVKVMGFDTNRDRYEPSKVKEVELGYDRIRYDTLLKQAVDDHNLKFADTVQEIVDHSDIIFIAVQTPHEPKYDGTSPMPVTTADFNYTALTRALHSVLDIVDMSKLVVVISTCLPGTMDRLLQPFHDKRVAYNPFFIAMGAVIPDFYFPEFVLLGIDHRLTHDEQIRSLDQLEWFYRDVLPKPVPTMRMSIASAELTKVGYNTFISMKIATTNVLMQAAHSVPGCNIDDVSRALGVANRRVSGPGYLRGGMGDGGGCHPRDNIAMSHFAEIHGIHYNIFRASMEARQAQCEWFAREMANAVFSKATNPADLHIGILGYAFKPNIGLTDGSPALLLKHYLKSHFPHNIIRMEDPHVLAEREYSDHSEWDVVFVGCAHLAFKTYSFKEGAIVIDPFRYLPESKKWTVRKLGVCK